MANINNNRIGASLSETTLQGILDSIRQFDTDLPFLTGLTREERQSLPKSDRVNRVFVEQTLQELANNPQLIPPYLDVQKIRTDFELFKKLDEIKSAIDSFNNRLGDTRILAGSEAYSGVLLAYNLIKVAATAGVPGANAAKERLKPRFQARNTPRPTDTDETDTTSDEDQMTEE